MRAYRPALPGRDAGVHRLQTSAADYNELRQGLIAALDQSPGDVGHFVSHAGPIGSTISSAADLWYGPIVGWDVVESDHNFHGSVEWIAPGYWKLHASIDKTPKGGGWWSEVGQVAFIAIIPFYHPHDLLLLVSYEGEFPLGFYGHRPDPVYARAEGQELGIEPPVKLAYKIFPLGGDGKEHAREPRWLWDDWLVLDQSWYGAEYTGSAPVPNSSDRMPVLGVYMPTEQTRRLPLPAGCTPVLMLAGGGEEAYIGTGDAWVDIYVRLGGFLNQTDTE